MVGRNQWGSNQQQLVYAGSNPVLTTKIKDMVIVKLKNCIHQNRKNQNTTFFFSERKYGFNKGDIVTCDWVLNNLELLTSDIKRQNNTKVEIEQR